MKTKIIYITIISITISFLSLSGFGQVLPTDRQFEWHKAGLERDFKTEGQTINIVEFGANNEGTSPVDNIVQTAISSLNNQFGIIYFPSGTYVFNEPLILSDSVIIQGDGAENTFLTFDLGGGRNLIQAVGSASVLTEVTEKADRGSNTLSVANNSNLAPGDLIRVFQDDSDLVISDWALKSTGQIIRVEQVINEGIVLKDKLRMTYDPSKSASIEKIEPITNVGIKCLNIRRLDASITQTSNIKFKYAANCLVQGIESNFCNFAHLDLAYSTAIQVSGSYFHNGFNYGGGGKAYGVVTHFSTGNCLIQNNIFEHLRHSMLLQAGANGNVFGYNYSTDAFWEEIFSPSDAAGDMVLHGNFPYANLFEGNIVQNIVIDNSHDINGPFNTFLRNRAELYGIVMLPSPPSHQQNFIGNDISNVNEGNGLFITFGNDHFSYGNLVKNEITPENTTTLTDTSYYLSSKPAFIGHFPWPAIGTPLASAFYPNPALQRYKQGEFTSCGNEIPIITNIETEDNTDYTLYPNPNNGEFIWERRGNLIGPAQISIIDMKGNLIYNALSNENLHYIQLNNISHGIYLFIVSSNNQAKTFHKLIIRP